MGDFELLIVSVLAFFSFVNTACVQGLFVVALSHASVQENNFAEKSARLVAACHSMHLTTQLTNRICRYHSYLYMLHMDSDAQDLFAQLSMNLYIETRVHGMQNLITKAD